MIYTVKINDSTPTGKRIINDLRKHPKTVEFEIPADNGVPPEGYMTLDEFEKEALKTVNQFCDEHGIY